MISIKQYIGDRAFYKKVLTVTVPIMIQNGITNLVNLLDNVMVGRLGTEAMSGVSIVNQFIFIFNLLIFGAISAAGIFTAQYYGLKDNEGVRHTFRFKFLINLLAGIIGVAVFILFSDGLISLFLHDAGNVGDLELTRELGHKYLNVMLFGLIPYAISQVYASTMRETGETVMPMLAGIVAVVTNFVLNLILIFGYLGAPAMGVRGAALATVISRFAELIVLVAYAHIKKDKFPYLTGAYRSFRIPAGLFATITVKGIPLMLNEFFWAIAMTMRNQCYSTRGLDVVAAQNISSTIFNLFSVVYISLGSGIAIIIGSLLGAGRLDEAEDTDKKLIGFSIMCGVGVCALLSLSSIFFPSFYNTTDEVRSLASYMMVVSALTMPFCAFANAAYFTLRSGGKVMITILFDSFYMWTVVVPACAIFAYLTDVSIYVLFAIGQGVDIFKMIFGSILLKRKTWLKTIVTKTESADIT